MIVGQITSSRHVFLLFNSFPWAFYPRLGTDILPHQSTIRKIIILVDGGYYTTVYLIGSLRDQSLGLGDDVLDIAIGVLLELVSIGLETSDLLQQVSDVGVRVRAGADALLDEEVLH